MVFEVVNLVLHRVHRPGDPERTCFSFPAHWVQATVLHVVPFAHPQRVFWSVMLTLGSSSKAPAPARGFVLPGDPLTVALIVQAIPSYRAVVSSR